MRSKMIAAITAVVQFTNHNHHHHHRKKTHDPCVRLGPGIFFFISSCLMLVWQPLTVSSLTSPLVRYAIAPYSLWSSTMSTTFSHSQHHWIVVFIVIRQKQYVCADELRTSSGVMEEGGPPRVTPFRGDRDNLMKVLFFAYEFYKNVG